MKSPAQRCQLIEESDSQRDQTGWENTLIPRTNLCSDFGESTQMNLPSKLLSFPNTWSLAPVLKLLFNELVSKYGARLRELVMLVLFQYGEWNEDTDSNLNLIFKLAWIKGHRGKLRCTRMLGVRGRVIVTKKTSWHRAEVSSVSTAKPK